MPLPHEVLTRPAAVLFDMDGTLVQSREAVWRIFEPINRQFDLEIESAEDFYEIFTQNLLDGLTQRCGDEQLAQSVIDEFFLGLRAHYRPQFVPGMVEVVRTLAATTTLAVVTTNVMEVVRQILVEHGVATCFAHVFSGDVEPSKARVVQHLKSNAAYTLARHCAPYYDEADRVEPGADNQLVMVTDTVGDVRAARSEGIRVVGVTWGMHSEERLFEAGADAVALWPQELLALLSDGGTLTAGGEACTIRTSAAGETCAIPAPAAGEASDIPSPAAGEAAALIERVRAGHDVRRARLARATSRREAGADEAAFRPLRDAQLAAAMRRVVSPDRQ